jgi:hypothetical protein
VAGDLRAFEEAPAPRTRSRGAFYFLLIAIVVFINGLGYRIYKTSLAQQAAPPTVALPEPTAPEPPPERALARARRLAGLAALEVGDYQKAVRELEAAREVGNTDADLPELIRIARDLAERPGRPAAAAPEPAPVIPTAAAPPAAPAASPIPPPAKPAVRPPSRPEPAPARKPARERARRKETRVAAAQPVPAPEPEPATGTLLVTSIPSGLVVEVDGVSVDTTPARVKVDPGAHAIALMKGETRLTERRLQVPPGGMASFDADLTSHPALVPRPREEPEEVVDPELAGEPPAPAPSAAPRSRELGEIYVTSPSIYGEVYINGRRYGYPPLIAKEVPAGPAVVEVRVKGVTRRSATVEVTPQKRISTRLR